MRVYLIDGTYELFRHYFAVPSHKTADDTEVAAVRGVLYSVLALLKDGVTHLGVATDHVIESFRNDLWPEYKNGAGVARDLYAQFPILEEALSALGIVVWPMNEYEADDALASAAFVAACYADQVLICTPDKDLAQCVVGSHIVQLDRRTRTTLDENAVMSKFGVAPGSMPDYLALVGDNADGFSGLPGWGSKSTAAVLSRYLRIEAIPPHAADWDITVRGAGALSAALEQHRELAMLFKDLATLRTSVPVAADADTLRWRGPRKDFGDMAEYLGAPGLTELAESLAASSRE